MKAYAQNGDVLVAIEQPETTLKDGKAYQVYTRREAIELLIDIAQAIHHAGDLSDPDIVKLRYAIADFQATI